MQNVWEKFDKHIKNAFEKAGFSNFTDIQQKVLPHALDNEDILASAKTGTGKTLAYVLPIVQQLLNNKNNRALILVPTKELAIQIDNVFKLITNEVGLNTVNLIGGAVINLQRKILLKNPEIVVATPGRLMDHVRRGNLKMDFEILVLDEADKLLELGFYKVIKEIIEKLSYRKQTMLFSATMPKGVLDLAYKLLKNPIEIDIEKAGEVVEEIEQLVYLLSFNQKNSLLKKIVQEHNGKILIFVKTKENATMVTRYLRSFREKVVELHGSRQLKERKDAINGFMRDKYRVMIATDIASRGLDIEDIKLVINYDMPNKAEDYVHRIGRTGRIGKQGKAITFVTLSQKSALKDIELLIGKELAISTMQNVNLKMQDAQKGRRTRRNKR